MQSHSRRRLIALTAACAGVLACAPRFAPAATTATWDNGGGDSLWKTNTNWNPDGAVAGNDAKFTTATASTSNSAVTSVIDTSLTINSVEFNQVGVAGGSVFHAVEIRDGQTLTINGSTGAQGTAFYVGSGLATGGATDQTYTYFQNQSGAITGGSLVLNNAAADLAVRETSSSNSGHMATLDLSKLSNFTATMHDLKIGVGDSTAIRAEGTMWLASNTNIAANSVVVGFNSSSGTTGNPGAILKFGANNTINTNSMIFAGRATQGVQAGFPSTVSNGVMSIYGAGGPGTRTDLQIGANPIGDSGVASSITNAILDTSGATSGFSAGTLNAQLGTVAIGRAAATTVTARQGVGTLSFSKGTIDANDLTVGDDNATTTNSTGSGTLNVKGDAQLIVNNSFTLAKRTGTGTATGYTGVLNIDGTGSSSTPAKVRVSAPITDQGGVSTISVTNGGTLQAKGLGSSANPIDNMTLNNAVVIVDIGNAAPTSGNAWGYAGSLTTGGTLTLGLQFGGTLATGRFQAIHYNTGGGSPTLMMSGKQPARVTAHAEQTVATNSFDIVVDSVLQPRWNGVLPNASTSNVWDVNNTSNKTWVLTGSGTGVGDAAEYQEDLTTYTTTDSVIFDDSAAGSTNVNVSTTVLPNAVTVNNSTLPYTFSGTGKISGTTGILKLGTNTLTIANTGGNDFTGVIDIQGGTLNTGGDEMLPNSASVSAKTGGTFDLGTHTETIGSLLVQGGTFTQSSGQLNATSATVSSGSLTAGAGTVTASNLTYSGGSLSAGTGTINATTLTVAGGVTLDAGTGAINAPTINLNDGTLAAGNITTSAVNAINGTINLALSGATTLTINGTASTTVTVNGNNTYTGATVMNGGKLLLTNGNALGAATATGNLVIGGAAATTTSILQLTNNISVPEPITLRGRNGSDQSTQNNTPGIQNVSGNNTLTGDLTITTGGTLYTIESVAGKLTMAGNFINPITGTSTSTRDVHLKGAGDGEISGNITQTGGDITAITKQGSGTWTLSGNNNYTGATVVEAGTLAFGGAVNKVNALTVQASAKAVITPGAGKVLDATGITLAGGTDAWTSQLDVHDNDVILHSTGGNRQADVDRITNQLKQGLNATTNSNQALFWTGQGIITSNGWQGGSNYTGVGVTYNDKAAAGLPAGPLYTLFDGQTVGVNDVLVKYTWFGDADLDGAVTSNDYFQIDTGFLGNKTGWINGDFDYNGVINTNDYFLIDSAFLAQGGTVLSPAAASLPAGVTAVPEPASLSVLGLAAAGLLRRRRRA